MPPPPTGPPILVQTQPGQPPVAMTMAPPRMAVGPPPPGLVSTKVVFFAIVLHETK